MSYTPSTDLLALLRQTSGGVRVARAPTLDVVLLTLSSAGLFNMEVGQTAPTTDEATTAWFRPADPSWASEGALFLWDVDAGEYVAATPALFFALLQASG